jgi:predicted enzyme related to lactoylglutathione lyase
MVKRCSGVCLITLNVPSLCAFYETVLQVPTRESNDLFADFAIEGATFSIFSVRGMEDMAPDSMIDAGTGWTTIDFEVADADQEYARICALNIPIVKPPETYPWGRRSFWFRDPDGNIVNFYAVV